jgi:hypothetical protein
MPDTDDAYDLEQMLLDEHPWLKAQYAELQALPTHLLPIVVGALIDSRLSALCRSKLVRWDGTERLVGESGSGLNYAAKVRLTVSLGLVPIELAPTLMILGHVRNHFAHNPSPSLSEPQVRAKLVQSVHSLHAAMMRGNGFNEAEIADAQRETEQQLDADLEKHGRALLCFIWVLFEAICAVISPQIVRLETIPDDAP